MKYQTIRGNKFYYDDEWLSGQGLAPPYAGCRKKSSKDNDIAGLQKRCFPMAYYWIDEPGDHEKDELNLIKKNLKPENSVLELGGFIGVTACFSNDIIENKENHVVTEMCPEYIKYLTINKELNDKKFIIHPFKIEKIEELDKYGIKFDTLVMDIEGDEYDFIPNNIDYLSKNIKTIIAEFHPQLLADRTVKKYRLKAWHNGHPTIKLLHKRGFKGVGKRLGKAKKPILCYKKEG